jgi:hypothetical protein
MTLNLVTEQSSIKKMSGDDVKRKKDKNEKENSIMLCHH